MNKQTLFVSLTTAVMLCACQSSKVKISGRFVGNDAKDVYLEQVLPLTQSVIDSAVLDKDGNYRFELKGVAKTPSLYNIIYNGERIPLFLAGGEKLSLNSVGSVVRNYTVEGSKESELLRQFYQAFVSGAQRLDNIASQFAKATLSEEDRQALVKEYTAEYYRIRREQLRFIIENKASLAAVYALYQRLPGDTYLFNGDSDVVYYRTVAEAIEQTYPESPYLQSLMGEIARMDARISLSSQITEAGYPDLELSDIYGKKVRLSSLAGKVVLLDFWSAEGQQQYAQCRTEGGLSEICRRPRRIRGLPGCHRHVEALVDFGRAGAAASLGFGERPARARIVVAGTLQRAETSGQFPDRQGGEYRREGYLRQEPRTKTR